MKAERRKEEREKLRGGRWEEDSMKTSSFRLALSKNQTRDRAEL